MIELFPPSGKGKGGSRQSRARSIMGLRDIGFTLPPGFRFHPSDEELLCHYLYRKVTDGASAEGSTMVEVDLHAREPWELPDAAKLGANEWYFFSFRDRKYATGSRTNRATRSGYWKATGKDRVIYDPSTRAMVGLRKTLVFYTGRAPHGAKTNWVMHEFRLETPHSPPKEDWVLCRVFHKRKGEAQDHEYKPGSSSPNNVPDHHMNSAHFTRRQEEEEEDYFSSSPLLDMCSARDFPQMGMGMGMASTPLMECGDHDEFAFLFDLGLEQGFRLPRW